MHTSRFGLKLAAVFLLVPLTATAAVTRTELAGNPLPQFPFFEYVRAFNVNAPVNVADRSDAFSGHRRRHLRYLRGEPQDPSTGHRARRSPT